MKAALLPQSCCQACTMCRRQQLTSRSDHGFYLEGQERQRKKLSLLHLKLVLHGAICCLLRLTGFKAGICFVALAVLISSRCRKVIRAGHPVSSAAPGSLWLPLGMAAGESLTLPASAQGWGCPRPPSVPQFISLLPTPICSLKNSMSQAWVKVLKYRELALNSGCILKRKPPNFCVCEISDL